MSVKVFFCYAHEDEESLNKLKIHLRPLEREGYIEIWYDRNISAGKEWEKEINNQLNVAQIIILLISPDFMASDFCYSIEMKRAIERHVSKDARVIPVILRPVYWQVKPLNKLQALPTDVVPVMDRSWHTLDEAFYNVAEGIRKVAMELARSCDILSYNPLDGSCEFHSIDDQGSYTLLEQHQWQEIWTHIIPGNFTVSRYANLFFHSTTMGRVKILTTDGRGGIKLIKEHPNWQKHSTQVVYIKSV